MNAGQTQNFSHLQLIDRYLQGPAQLREAAKGLTPEQARAHPVPGKWSVLEVVCHLADFDPIQADRMKRIIAEEKPQLIGASEDAFAKALAYGHRDLEEELRIIDLTRSQMGRILKTLPAEAFTRTGLHSERGELTLMRMVDLAANHIPHHLKFIVDKRKALGVA